MIYLEDSYLQYTNKLTGIKKARAEAHLNTLRNVEAVGLVTIKDWIVNSYLSNLKATQEDDYTKYNRRTGEMTKPKTVYWLEAKNGGHYEITKIAYDFYNYIEKLKATEKDIINCIQYEKQLEEKKRIEEEKAEQIRRQQLEIEKEKRKEEFRKKRQEYIRQGMPILKPYFPILEQEVDKCLEHIEKQAPRQKYLQEIIDRYAWEIGNPRLLKMSSEQYCIKQAESTRPNDIMFRNIYTRLLHIEPNDSGQTVSAKIRAFLEGRKYKPTTKREASEIKGYKRNRDNYYEIEGEPKKLYNETLIMAKDADNNWGLTEVITGLLLTGGSSKKELLDKLKNIKETKSEEAIYNIIKKGIERFGVSPKEHGVDGKYPYKRKDYKLNLEVRDKAQGILSLNDVNVAVHSLSKGITIGVDMKTGVVLTVQPTAKEVIEELTQYIEKETYDRLVEYKVTGKL